MTPPVPPGCTWGPELVETWWFAVADGRLVWWFQPRATDVGRWHPSGETIQDEAWRRAYAVKGGGS